MPVPRVFDRPLIRQRLTRASPDASTNFLYARVAEDLSDRLETVQRPLADVLDLGSPGPQLAQHLQQRAQARLVVHAWPARPVVDRPSAVLSTVADEELLPFARHSFDCVVSALALHSVNDLPGVLTQARQILRPDGLFLAAMLGGQTLSELRQVLAAAEAERTGGASPRVAPFVDLRDLGHLLQRAGLALPVTDVDRLTIRYDTLFALLADLRALGATNALVDRSRKPPGRAFFRRAAEIYAERFADADGRIRATFDIVWLSGWAPHESQQKPLKPGSAKMRLADALGVQERPLKANEP